MAASAPKRSYLLGGIILCVFPVVILLVMHINRTSLPMPLPILFGLFFLHGLRAVIWSLCKLDIDNTASWLVDALGAAGCAVCAFWVAWQWKDGWSGGLPFIPDSWNQNLARILFAIGGLIAVAFTVRLLRKALNRLKSKPDEGIRHA